MNGPRCRVIEVEHLERTLALLHSTGYGEVCRDMPCYIPAKRTRSPAAARLELWFADQSSPKVFSAILKFKIWVYNWREFEQERISVELTITIFWNHAKSYTVHMLDESGWTPQSDQLLCFASHAVPPVCYQWCGRIEEATPQWEPARRDQ